MGDYADDLLDAHLADYYGDFEDVYEYTDFDLPRSVYEPREITCKYCKAKSLYWIETDNGWRLQDADGKLHTCRTITEEDLTF